MKLNFALKHFEGEIAILRLGTPTYLNKIKIKNHIAIKEKLSTWCSRKIQEKYFN